MIRNPWDPPAPPPGTHRVVGTVGGMSYRGEWLDRERALVALAKALEAYGDGMRLETREDVQARERALELRRMREAKAALDRARAPSVAEAERELERRKRARELEPPIALMPGIERPPYASLKHALGDLAAHYKGPKLAQPKIGGRNPHRDAWMVVGSLMHGPPPDGLGIDPLGEESERLLRWASTADQRGGRRGVAPVRVKLTRHDYRIKARLEDMLRLAGMIRAT